MTIALTLAIQLLVLGETTQGQGLPVSMSDLRDVEHTRSWQSLRQGNVTRQKWDLSCGAAALSTIFTYDLDVPVSESEIVVWILHRTNPVKIRANGGFSLFDLKRFAKFRGYDAVGYADMTLDDLQELRRPAIVATTVHTLNHFMVFRGKVADRVVLADPAFGTTTMTVQQFQSIWARGIAFVVLPHNEQAPVKLQPKQSDLLVADSATAFRRAIDMGQFKSSWDSYVLSLAISATLYPRYFQMTGH
jgi:uncharacterized protein